MAGRALQPLVVIVLLVLAIAASMQARAQGTNDLAALREHRA
jgi:hypothetical protein